MVLSQVWRPPGLVWSLAGGVATGIGVTADGWGGHRDRSGHQRGWGSSRSRDLEARERERESVVGSVYMFMLCSLVQTK
jgi:hypothetical protein